MKKCPCCSGKEYSLCCEPYHLGVKTAPTAEELMRSRYSAYEKVNIDYIIDTMLPEKGDAEKYKVGVKRWAEESTWEKLEIIETQEGGIDDSKGYVEFKAYYTIEGEQQIHHEIASFEKKDGNKWIFISGKEPIKQVVNEEPKVGRNDPCPCGSGKKYKKCCG